MQILLKSTELLLDTTVGLWDELNCSPLGGHRITDYQRTLCSDIYLVAVRTHLQCSFDSSSSVNSPHGVFLVTLEDLGDE